MYLFIFRIREAQEKGVTVVDVDGSYCEKKCRRLLEMGVDVPQLSLPSDLPPQGWTEITEKNFEQWSTKLPNVTSGELYRYLAKGVGHGHEPQGVFWALTRGYNFWASGRIQAVFANINNPKVCFIRAKILSSMKSETYNVALYIGPDGIVERAICKCAAG